MCVSTSVVCDRLITNRSGSGDPDLQGLACERWRGTGPRATGARRRFFTLMQREGQELALRASGTISYEGLYPIGKNKFDKFGEKWYHFKKLGQMPSLQCEGQALALRTPETISYAEKHRFYQCNARDRPSRYGARGRFPTPKRAPGTLSVGQPTREHETGDTL